MLEQDSEEYQSLRNSVKKVLGVVVGLLKDRACAEVELLKQFAEERAKHEDENAELWTRIEKGRTDTVDAIAELKAEVVKLRDDNEENNQQTFLNPK
ncbi:hypothetical protein RhiirC2_850855 [Rhizophagus irregularis]|uniref:Uncharacterized protein n=1 Tax=Rhizophagus irregularis TaxID=588596 RepID=A0A2N1N5W1_9GLOM|nr:hypothetical protein RhiirC2_850855 [Rhizophagus irregularis]